MKKTLLLSAAVAALSLLASCAREDCSPAGSDSAAGSVQTLTATFAPGEVTRTFFDGTTFKWKEGDAILVRSDKTDGYTVFNNATGESAGSVTFVAATDDNIIYEDEGNSYAVYPSYINDGCPKIEERILKLCPKTTYTWSEGNVEAPMIAKVVAGQELQFTHMCGLLKVTYKNIPPKARYIKVTAPIDATHYYKISQTMGPGGIFGWEDGPGFTLEKPYFKAYNNGKTTEYSVKIDINAVTAAQRASDEGIIAFIPLPVGPTVVSEMNVYPTLKLCLTFADGTEVPGSLRTATNVQIERAHIKPMPAIALTKYTVEVVAGTDNTTGDTNGTGSAARFRQVRGLCWLNNNNLLLSESNGTNNATRNLRQYNKTSGAVTTLANLALAANNNNAAWQGEMHNGIFHVINKGLNRIYTWNPSTNAVTDALTIGSSPMCIRFYGEDAYVVSRNDSKVYKLEGGINGTKTTFFDFSTLDLGSTDGQVNWPVSLCFDADGNAIVTVGCSKGGSPSAYMIYIINSSGAIVNTIGKGGTVAASAAAIVDGAKDNATFTANMNGLRLGPDGAVYLAERGAIRRITHSASDYSDAVVTTILGGGSSYTTAVGATAMLDWSNGAQDIIFDPSNNSVFYYTDMRYTLKKVTIE